jgi:cytochrome b6-f complex iron-sulfur subunit
VVLEELTRITRTRIVMSESIGKGASPFACSGNGCEHSREPALDALSGIGRRTFIVQSALLAAAAALAACGASDATAPDITPDGTNNVIKVSSYPALSSVGGVAMVTIGRAPIAIVRTSESAFLALSRVCPHQGGTVQQSGTGFQCPEHGARFSQTGQWVGGERTSSLRAYNTAYDPAAGTLTIT